MIVFADRETHRGFLREKQQERAVKYAIPAETRRIMKISTKTIVTVGMFTAVLSVLSILTIPMPTGVPVTLQTFAMALCGYVLGWKKGTSSTLIYILLGTVGVPVFAGMTGGPSWLAGYSGGFIWGFIFLTMLCGVGMAQKQIWLRVLFPAAFVAVSVPYIVKDVISVVGAYLVAIPIRKALAAGNILEEKTKAAV